MRSLNTLRAGCVDGNKAIDYEMVEDCRRPIQTITIVMVGIERRHSPQIASIYAPIYS